MKHAILACNGLDKPEGSVAREVAIRAAEATESEIICPVLLNRAPARYKKVLADRSLIVVDGCSTRCATKLATGLGAKVERKALVSDAVKASGKPLGSHSQAAVERPGACPVDCRRTDPQPQRAGGAGRTGGGV